jgi:galactose oxidase
MELSRLREAVGRRTAWRTIAGAVVALAALGLGSAPAAAYSTPGQWIDQNSDQCIGVDFASQSPGARIVQYACDNYTDQNWIQDPTTEIDSGGRAYFRWVDQNSGQCIGVTGGSLYAGAKIIQWPCYNAADQHWAVVSTGGDYSALVNFSSGMCLGVPGGSLALGTQLVQWYCNGAADQNWRFTGS